MSLIQLFLPRRFSWYYRIGSIRLPRPHKFVRENLYVKSDMITISGKTGRDIVSKKERFVLTWDLLGQTTVDDIMDLINLNAPVNFEVSDSNYSLTETSCHPIMKNRTYQTPGGDYINTTQLELTEVN